MKGMLARKQTAGEKEEKRRKRFPFYLLISCLIHSTLIILLAFLFARHFVRSKETPPPPEVTLIIPPTPHSDRPTVTAAEPSDKPPEDAPFQSDQNSKAASELPPEGSLPVPTQEGSKLPGMEFQNQKHTVGEKPAEQAAVASQPQPPLPVHKPAEQPSPNPSPTPVPAPTPSPDASPTSPNEIKPIQPTEPQSQPKPKTPNPPPPATPGTQGMTKGYRPETVQTVIRGNISNRGRSSVSAEATPIGRYKKAVADAIGSRWYYYVDERMGLLSIGTVDVTFRVTSAGKVTGLRVVRSNGNSSLENCSIQSITDAKLPPIPRDIAATLQNGCMEIDYSFTIY